jgi:hypothetical protein
MSEENVMAGSVEVPVTLIKTVGDRDSTLA